MVRINEALIFFEDVFVNMFRKVNRNWGKYICKLQGFSSSGLNYTKGSF